MILLMNLFLLITSNSTIPVAMGSNELNTTCYFQYYCYYILVHIYCCMVMIGTDERVAL